MKRLLLTLLLCIVLGGINCAAPPDTSRIRPLIREFLIALSRHDTAKVLERVTDAFVSGAGGEDAIMALSDHYTSYLVPNLFEFDSPQPDGDAWRTRTYLHDGKRNMIAADIWTVAVDGGWKVDRVVWYQQTRER